jgi:predicted Zn finger-like uncharacterized protein
MIEVQCTSCHTRYRIDERVLPEGLPTFKCSRCGHVFSFEPRQSRSNGNPDSAVTGAEAAETANESPAGGGQIPEAEVPPGISQVAAPSEASFPSEDLLSRASGPSVSSETKLPGVQPEAVKEAELGRRFQPRRQESVEPQSRENPHPAENSSASASRISPQVTTERAEEFNSRVFTVSDPDAASGENLSFDFADEEPAPDRARLTRRSKVSGISERAVRESVQWQVGDEDSTAVETLKESRRPSERVTGGRSRARLRAKEPEPQFNDDGLEAEEEAPVYNRAMTHSARFFVLLIFLVAAGFGAMTLLIHNAPGRASAVLSSLPVIGDRFVQPAAPAKMVALRDVNAVYQQNQEGRKALLISGSAENVSTESLRLVQLTAAIHDVQGRSLASHAVYCGNNVSAGMVSQMTPHEIEFFQQLEPAKTFALEPSTSCRFVAVFMNPPATAHAYDVAVSQAVAGTAQAVEERAP